MSSECRPAGSCVPRTRDATRTRSTPVSALLLSLRYSRRLTVWAGGGSQAPTAMPSVEPEFLIARGRQAALGAWNSKPQSQALPPASVSHQRISKSPMAIKTSSEGTVSSAPRQVRTPAKGPLAVRWRVRVDGKQFEAGDERFSFRGVTYGTFSERRDGAMFPETGRLREDLAAIAASGFTVVRTYTPPPPDMVEAAGENGLRM